MAPPLTSGTGQPGSSLASRPRCVIVFMHACARMHVHACIYMLTCMTAAPVRPAARQPCRVYGLSNSHTSVAGDLAPRSDRALVVDSLHSPVLLLAPTRPLLCRRAMCSDRRIYHTWQQCHRHYHWEVGLGTTAGKHINVQGSDGARLPANDVHKNLLRPHLTLLCDGSVLLDAPRQGLASPTASSPAPTPTPLALVPGRLGRTPSSAYGLACNHARPARHSRPAR